MQASAKGAKKTASESCFIEIQGLKLYSGAACALLRAFREIPTKPRLKRAFAMKSVLSLTMHVQDEMSLLKDKGFTGRGEEFGVQRSEQRS
jgi:hypothetical protein